MDQRPRKYAVGDRVVIGSGKSVLTVVAVIDTGRITTYDLSGWRRYIGFPHTNLFPAPQED